MKNKHTYHALWLLLVLVAVACKKETIEPDPCCGASPVTANFGMMEGGYRVYDYYGFVPDIAFARGYITFRALPQDPEATYTWYLGKEVLTGSQITRDFSSTDSTENNIPVTLVIKKAPNKECYPNDDGYDSVTKYIRFVENNCEYLTNGDFKVLFKGQKDSTIVSVRNWRTIRKGHYIPDCQALQIGIGFDPTVPTDTNWVTNSKGIQLYSSILFDKTTSGSYIDSWYNGYFKVNPATWQVEASYSLLQRDGNSGYELNKYTFKGRKIR